MRTLIPKRRLLSETEEVLYFGPPEFLEEEVVARALNSLHEPKVILKLQPKNTVERDTEETVSWIRWYTGFQIATHCRLRQETGHDLSLLLIVARDRYQLDVVFRMSKPGFGNIQYRLSVQRTRGELFLCYEG